MPKRISVPGRPSRRANVKTLRKRIYHADSALALSIVLPTHVSAAPLLERTLLALGGQDFPPERFEVVVAADGGDPTRALTEAVNALPRPYVCRLAKPSRARHCTGCLCARPAEGTGIEPDGAFHQADK
jgi:hypothetical protein